jgi:hypothetical protein
VNDGDSGGSGRGRTKDYDPAVCGIVRKRCLAGATDVEIAEFLGVSTGTLYRWRADYPEFRAALKTGKNGADQRVAQSLYHRACGYSSEETEAVKVKDITYENGKKVQESERVELVSVRRRLPLDVRAATFWLKNRRPDLWRDKQDHEVTGKDGAPLEAPNPREIAKAILDVVTPQQPDEQEGSE